jgi:tripartite-type tricarboxylate transporter receptor subunit TctC
MRTVIARCVAMLTAWAMPLIAHAETPAEFYRGKTITLYVGFGPGGGYDAYAQILAPYLRLHIPGEPAIIIKHMPGAGSLLLMNYLANVAPRDGTAFGIPASSAALAPLIGTEQERTAAKFDARKLGWLGSLEKFTPIGIAWRTAGFKTLDDARKRVLRFGSSGPSSGGEIYAQLLNDMLGTKLHAIRGYRGSNDITLAMERGELDGFIGWCWTCMKADRPQFLADGLVDVFIQFGHDPDATSRGIPSIYDLVTDPADKQVVQLVLGNLELSRPFVAPQEVPADRLDALRRAFEATTKDPAFLAAAAKSGREISPMFAPEIDALLADSYAMPKAIIDRAIAVSTK